MNYLYLHGFASRPQSIKLILHGIADEVIPVEASRHYAAQNPKCNLIVPSDHGLTDVLPEIWAATQQFCRLK